MITSPVGIHLGDQQLRESPAAPTSRPYGFALGGPAVGGAEEARSIRLGFEVRVCNSHDADLSVCGLVHDQLQLTP
ncbi:MAG TPA: hypothetical protein VJN19_06990 [Propionibacteriaceae bacterium]|nr:hypothetical protein [Propionibacteriaceae bacterium]